MKRMLIVLVALVACEPKPKPPQHAPTDSAPTLGATPPASTAINERIVLFVEATSAQLDSLREKYSEEDYATVVDDRMWYLATAYEYLEKLKLPVRRLSERQVFEFVVDGQPRRYDFADHETLDLIVLYDTNREPRAIAPVDIEAVHEYFRIPRPDSAQ